MAFRVLKPNVGFLAGSAANAGVALTAPG